jgi:DNA-binding transcriptional regulator GbsR (MarR family)
MADAYERAREEFITSVERIAAQFGGGGALPRRILAYLVFTPRPVSLNELCDNLHVAKSGVSVNVRALENFGLVRKAWVKGERKDFYEADFKLARLYANSFAKMAEMGVGAVFESVERSLRMLDGDVAPGNRADAAAIRERLEREVRLKEPVIELFDRFVQALQDLSARLEGGE